VPGLSEQQREFSLIAVTSGGFLFGAAARGGMSAWTWVRLARYCSPRHVTQETRAQNALDDVAVDVAGNTDIARHVKSLRVQNALDEGAADVAGISGGALDVGVPRHLGAVVGCCKLTPVLQARGLAYEANAFKLCFQLQLASLHTGSACLASTPSTSASRRWGSPDVTRDTS